MTQWAIIYDLGGRGRLFIVAESSEKAQAIFVGAFPDARVVRISVVR